MTRSIPLNRRRLIQLGAAGLAAPALAGRAFGQDKFVCKIAHSEAIGSPFTNAFDKWAGLAEREVRRPDRRPALPGQPARRPCPACSKMSRIGTIQVTAAGPDSEEAIAPEIAAFGGAPGFIYKNEAHVDAVLQGPLGEEVSARSPAPRPASNSSPMARSASATC